MTLRRLAWVVLSAVLASVALVGLAGVLTLADAITSVGEAGYLSPIIVAIMSHETTALTLLGTSLVAIVFAGAIGALVAWRRAILCPAR